MIHQLGSSFYDAQTGEFILKAKELLKLLESLTRVYVQRTGKAPMGCIRRHEKRCFYVNNRSPSS
ncbi:hypothetical protein Gotur_022882 [Gossypium turneri]